MPAKRFSEITCYISYSRKDGQYYAETLAAQLPRRSTHEMSVLKPKWVTEAISTRVSALRCRMAGG